jgi:hypothetical protein
MTKNNKLITAWYWIFVAFLVKEGAYIPFLFNCRTNNYNKKKNIIKHIVSVALHPSFELSIEIEVKYLILSAFIWNKKEKDYWNNISNKWEKYVDSISDPLKTYKELKPKRSKPNLDPNQKMFIDFLKRHDTLIPFCVNLNEPLFKYLNKYKLEESYLIYYSFDWNDTPEGELFWSELEDKWILFLFFI